MRNEFTAVIERAEDWFIASCPEVAGANGQGRARDQALKSLTEAIALVLEVRTEEGFRGLPEGAELEVVEVG